MSDKVTIDQQIDAVKFMAEICNQYGQLTPAERKMATAALETLRWLRDNRQIIDLAVMLWRDERTQAVIKEFPGAKIDKVRNINGRLLDDESRRHGNDY